MAKWEVLKGRTTYVDAAWVMRGITTACTAPGDLLYVLKALYFEQVTGLRSTPQRELDKHKKTPVSLARTILLRRTIIETMIVDYAKFKEDIEFYHSDAFYVKHYNISSEGMPVKEDTIFDRGDEESPAPAPVEEDNEGADSASGVGSKAAILDLVSKLVGNKLSTSLHSMAEKRKGNTILRFSLKNTNKNDVLISTQKKDGTTGYSQS